MTTSGVGARTIRVLLVDDHAVVRAGLSQMLGATGDMEVVGEASNGADGVAAALELAPDVILMDLSMPGMDGVEAISRITAQDRRVRILALTSFSDEARVLATVDAGAVGYLVKDADPQEVIRSVRLAADGQSPMDHRAVAALLGARRQSTTPVPGLTAREHEVLKMLTDGCQNKTIASRLGISEATVKAHLTSIFHTIGVSDRTQAALWAQRNGLGEGSPL
jgi:DNA-binding NarL/FixJ family response regulator